MGNTRGRVAEVLGSELFGNEARTVNKTEKSCEKGGLSSSIGRILHRCK